MGVLRAGPAESHEPQQARQAHNGLPGDAQLAASNVNPASEEGRELRETGMRPV